MISLPDLQTIRDVMALLKQMKDDGLITQTDFDTAQTALKTQLKAIIQKS